MNHAAAIIEQFQKKRADLRCRVCGNSNFNLLVSDKGDLRSYLELVDDSPTPTRMRTISAACGNCGHLEQFLADVLLDRPLGETK
jgi:hypothetical protein